MAARNHACGLSCIQSYEKILLNIMAEYKFYLSPLPGFVLLQKLSEAILEVFQSPTAFRIDTNLGSFSVGYCLPAELIKNGEFKRALTILSERPHAEVLKLLFQSERNTQNNQPTETLEFSGEGIFFKFTIQHDNQNRAIQVFDGLSKHYLLTRKAELALSSLPDEQKEALRIAAQINADFSAQAARLSQASIHHAEEVTKLLCEKTDELDKRFAAKEATLEERYVQKIETLESREKEHAETVKAFELRNNTAVRRDLLTKITDIIGEQKAVTISEKTIDKRKVVHAICAFTMIVATCGCIAFSRRILIGDALDWHLFLPLSASTCLFVSTVVYYIKWCDRWFRDHATAEFTNRKFAADILRASWLAELFFEWESKKETPFPPELLQAFARGLFTSEVTDGSNKHPFEDLTGAMKDLQTLRIGKGCLELSKKEKAPAN